ncbi:UNVERIFIED_CONTAM: hypothetical protein FKN15_041333 [Acipenser sinensis]
MLDYSSILAKCGTNFQCDVINITRANHLVKSTSDLLRLKTAPGDYQKSLAGNLTEGDQGEVTYKGVQLTNDKRLHRRVSENAPDSKADCAPWKSDFTQIIDNTVKYMDERFRSFSQRPLSSFSVFDTSLLPHD